MINLLSRYIYIYIYIYRAISPPSLAFDIAPKIRLNFKTVERCPIEVNNYGRKQRKFPD